MATMSSSAKDEVPSPSSKEDSNKTRQLDGDVKLTCHHADVTKTKGVCGQTSLRNSRDSSEDGITSAAEAMKHNPPASEPHHEGEGASKSSTPSNAKHSTDQSGRPKHRGVNEVNGQVDNGVSSDEENPLIIAMDEETKDPLDDKRVQTEQQQPKIMNPKKKILSEYVEGKNRAVNSNDFKSKTGADGDTIRHSSSCGDIAGQANVIDERPQTVPPPLAQIHRVSDRLNQLPGKQEKSGPHSPDQRLSINLQSCINHVLDSAAIRNKLSDSPEPHSPPEGISFETKGGESQKQKDRDAGGDVKLTQTSTDTEKYQEDGSDFHTSGQRLVNGSKAFAWHGYQDHGQTKKPTESSLWAQRQSTENRLVSPLHGNMAKNMVQDSPRRGTYNCGKPGDNQNVSVSSQMYQKQHYDSCSVGPPASTVTSCSFSLFGATTMTKQLAPMPGSVAATMRSSMPMAQSSRLPLDISSSRQDISQKRGSDGSVSQPKRHMGYYPGVGEMSTPYGAQTSAADYGRNQERFAVSSSSHGGVHRPSAFRYTTNVGIPTTVRPHAPPPTAPISAPLQQTAPGWSRTTPGPLASPAGVHRSIAGQPPLTRPHHGGIRGPCPNHHSTNQPGANPVHTVQRPAQQAPLPRLANQQWPLGSITHGSPLPQCQTYPERGGYGPRMPVPQRQTRIESRGQQQQHTGKAAAYPPTDAWRHNIAQGSCKIVSGLPSYQQISGHLSHQQRQQGAAGDNQSGVVRQGPPPLILARSLPEIHCRDEPHADIPRPSTQAGEPSYRSTGRDAPLDLSAASKCKPEEARPKNVDTKPSTTDADQPLDLSVKVPRPFEGSKDNPRSLASSYDGPRGVNVDSNQFQSKISLASSPSMYSLKQSSSAKAGNVALSCGLPPQQQVIDRQPSPTQGKTSGSTLYSNTLHYVPGQKHVYGAQATQPTLVPAPGSQTRSSIPKAEAAQPMVDYQLGISGGVMQPAAENKCSLQQGLLQPQDDDSSLAGTRPGRKRSRGYLIGSHPVEDILFLRCSVCGHTYGSIHSFRRHFLKHHGFEPKTENVTIQSISATKHAVNEAIHVNGTVMGKQELLQSLHLLPKCKEGDSPPRPYIGGYDDVINEKHVYLTGTNPQTPKAAYKNECNQDNKSCKSGASGVMSQQGQNTKDTRNATNALDAYKQKILTSSNSTSSVYEFHSHPCLACYQRCVEHYGPSGVAVVCPAIQGSKRVHYSRDTYGWVICEQCRYRVPKTCSQQACMNSLKQRDHQATSGSCIYSVDRSGMVGITGTAEDKKPVLAALDQSNQTDKNVFSAKHVCQDLSCRESDCKAYLLDLKKGHVDQNEKIKIDTPTFLKEEKPLELCAKKKCRTSESCAESNELPPSDPESQLDEKKLMKGTESGVDVGAEEDGSQITACQALRNAKSVFEFLQKSVETAIALDTMSEEEAKERPDKHERTKGKTGSELESHVKPDITNMTCNDTKNLPGDRRIKEEAVMKHCMVSPATNSIIKTEETEPLDCAQRKSENILSLTFSELVEGAFRSYEKEQQLHASIPSKTDPPKQTAPINPEFLMERFNKMCEKMTEEKPSGGETPRNTTDLQMTLCHSPRVQNIEDCDTESVTFRKCISIGETINKAINRCFNIPIEKISLPGLRTKSSCDSSEQVKQNLGTENANEPEANASASGQISQASGAAERTLTTCPKQDESLQKSDNISENKVAGTDEMIDDDISLKVWKKGRRKYANMQLLKKKAEGCNAKEGEQMKETVVQRSCSDQSVLDGSERKDADERQRDVYEHTSQSGTEAIKETDEAKGSGKKRADAGGKRKARAELGTETPPKAAKSSASEVPPQEVTIAPRRRGRPPLKAEHSAASRGEEKEKSAGSRGRTRGRTRGRRCDIQKTFMLRNRRGHKV